LCLSLRARSRVLLRTRDAHALKNEVRLYYDGAHCHHEGGYLCSGRTAANSACLPNVWPQEPLRPRANVWNYALLESSRYSIGKFSLGSSSSVMMTSGDETIAGWPGACAASPICAPHFLVGLGSVVPQLPRLNNIYLVLYGIPREIKVYFRAQGFYFAVLAIVGSTSRRSTAFDSIPETG